MTDEVAFLCAIRDEPGNDLRRLAFADWLEDRNDHRAAWVRDPELWATMFDTRGPVPRLGDPLEVLIPRNLLQLFVWKTSGLDQLVPRLGSVAPLVEVLSNPHPLVRQAAARMLGELGRVAVAAVPTLAKFGGDADERVRTAVAEAIERIRATGCETPLPTP